MHVCCDCYCVDCQVLHCILDGPVDREEVASKSVSVGHLEVTDVSRSWAKLWLTLHGRRFQCYNRRHGPEPAREAATGTDSAVKRSQLQALGNLAGDSPKRRKVVRVDNDVAYLPEETREVSNFRKHTQRRNAELQEDRRRSVMHITHPLRDVRSAPLVSNSPQLPKVKPEAFSKAGFGSNM